MFSHIIQIKKIGLVEVVDGMNTVLNNGVLRKP